MVENAQDVSTLMDGELDADRIDAVCRCLRTREGMQTWASYHLIGDALRGSPDLASGFSDRFGSRFAAEPTMLVPRSRGAMPARTAWAIAASAAAVAVVGWVAMASFQPASTGIAAVAPLAVSAPPVATVVHRGADLGDYVLVHQGYSPASAIQGVQPYIRAVSAEESSGR